MRKALFWGAGALVGYTYVGFPLLMLARGALLRRAYRAEDRTPPVSVVIAAHNEAPVIGGKVENLLALDYPRDRLEIVIASDGSDDGTDEIVRRYEDDRVRLLALPRDGKAAALNAAIESSRGEVLVFSDANSMLDRQALRALVRPLADPAVGGVAGDQRYLADGALGGAAVGERGYWGFDRLMKLSASRAGSVTGATGALYAVRRELVRPLRPDVNDDFLNSLRVIAAGYRLVFAPDAVAWEPVAESPEEEFGRKVRVMVRGLRCVFVMRELLDPRRHRFFALQLLSHKVLLRTMVVPLSLLAATSPLLWRKGRIYKAATLAQTVLYGTGAAGILLARRPIGSSKLLALPAYFCLVNSASAVALWKLLRREQLGLWTTRR